MRFTDPEASQTRARAVLALLPASSGARLAASETQVRASVSTGSGAALEQPTVFDALNGRITWQDVDGEARVLGLPEGVSSEAVAALLFGLASVADWS